MVEEESAVLADGLAAMTLSSTAEQRRKLLDFLRLLRKWNRVYNLTAIEEPLEMVRLHLLDSLAMVPYLRGKRVLDVGTGAGLPGIPLAILAGQMEFTLLDSNAKKTRFVQQAVIELNLRNVRVVQARLEGFQDPSGYDVILARAFASLTDIVKLTRGLLSAGGVILAQKGKSQEKEVLHLERATVETIPLTIPGVDAERHLLAVTLPG
jgi:16S rRNA (guanine527-N7)-methyltransferase